MFKRNYITLGDMMPTSHTEKTNGFTLWVKAHGLRHLRLFECIPYSSGDRVRLRIGVNKALRTPIKFEYKLTRWDMNMNLACSNILTENEKDWIEGSIQSGVQDLFDRQLFINGKHTLHMKYKHEGQESKEIVFFEFNLRDKDISMERILILVGGAIIGYLLTVIAGCFN